MSHAWLLLLMHGSPVAHQLADLGKAREKRKAAITPALNVSCWRTAGPTDGGICHIILLIVFA